ncbi:MAG: dipicolinate synthase subunit B [Eubacteriales bacterium]
MKIAFALTGSFCTHNKALAALEEIIKNGYAVTPVFSEIVSSTSTRFGGIKALEEKVVSLCGKAVLKTIPEVEEEITAGGYGCVVVCPCTGNTLAKVAHGITDTSVTMAVKAQLRNSLPVLLAPATNDALAGNLKNIGVCKDKKHLFFVPMAQDDFTKKPSSLVCDFTKVVPALKEAAEGRQLQPFFVKT